MVVVSFSEEAEVGRILNIVEMIPWLCVRSTGKGSEAWVHSAVPHAIHSLSRTPCASETTAVGAWLMGGYVGIRLGGLGIGPLLLQPANTAGKFSKPGQLTTLGGNMREIGRPPFESSIFTIETMPWIDR